MRPVRAQFARSWRAGRRWWLVVALLLGLAVWIGAMAWQSTLRGKAEQQARIERERRAQQMQALAQRLPALAPALYDASARELLAQSSVPWPELLAALEAVSVTGVQIVRIDYVATEARARVEVTSIDQATALEYLQALSAGVPASGFAWRWRPLQFSQLPAADKGTATIEAVWGAR